jgi:hypothetical protein
MTAEVNTGEKFEFGPQAFYWADKIVKIKN